MNLRDQASMGIGGVLDLNYGEHLIVWTLRRIVARRDICPLIIREFADACGEGSSGVLGVFRIFFEMLALAARRPLSIGYPGWGGVTPDERQLLNLVAAAQDDDHPRLDALLCWVVRGEAQARFVIALNALAAAFAAYNLRISASAPAMSPIAERGDLRLVSPITPYEPQAVRAVAD